MGSSAGILAYLCSNPISLVHGAIILIKNSIDALIAFEATEALVPSKSRVRGLGFHTARPEPRYWGFGTELQARFLALEHQMSSILSSTLIKFVEYFKMKDIVEDLKVFGQDFYDHGS